MFGRGDFNDSYYAHGCTISPEMDVIDIDIQGKGKAANLKRWWFDLFLLSYADKRARIYYVSSYAIKMERKRHFRRHRNRIHPLSKFRNLWDLTILLAAVMNFVFINHATSVLFGQYPWYFYAFGVLLELLIICDIYVNTRCGYIDHDIGRIHLDGYKSIIKYCSTKLFFHAASAIPILTIMFIRYGMDISCSLCKANKFACVLNFMNIIKLIRVFEVSSYLTRERKTFWVTRFCRFIRLWWLAGLSSLQFLCSYYAVTMLQLIDTGKIIEHSHFHIMLQGQFNGVKNFNIFTETYYNVLCLLLHHNYGFDTDIQQFDKISPIVLYCLTTLFHILNVVEIFTWVNCNKMHEDRIYFNKVGVTNIAKCRQLPDKLAYRLRSYYDFNITKLMTVEKQSSFFKSLPVIIKSEILMSSFIKKVIRIPYFSEWPTRIIARIVELLKEEICLKNYVVAESGEPGNGLVIIDAGVMAVYSANHVERGHLIDGDYFGELSLVTDKERLTTYIVAVTDCKVITLEKSSFRKFMREHARLFFKMKQMITDKYRSGEASTSLQQPML